MKFLVVVSILALVASVSCDDIFFEKAARDIVSQSYIPPKKLDKFTNLTGSVLYDADFWPYTAADISMKLKQPLKVVHVKEGKAVNLKWTIFSMVVTISLGKPELSTNVTFGRLRDYNHPERGVIEKQNFLATGTPKDDMTFDVLVLFKNGSNVTIAAVTRKSDFNFYNTTTNCENEVCRQVGYDIDKHWNSINIPVLGPILENALTDIQY